MPETVPKEPEDGKTQAIGAVPLAESVEIEWTPYELEMLDRYSREHDDSL